jgi:hypothetical protein
MEIKINIISGYVGTISSKENKSVLIIILAMLTLNWGTSSRRVATSCAKCGLFV